MHVLIPFPNAHLKGNCPNHRFENRAGRIFCLHGTVEKWAQGVSRQGVHCCAALFADGQRLRVESWGRDHRQYLARFGLNGDDCANFPVHHVLAKRLQFEVNGRNEVFALHGCGVEFAFFPFARFSAHIIF